MCPGEHVCVKMFQGEMFEGKKIQVKGLGKNTSGWSAWGKCFTVKCLTENDFMVKYFGGKCLMGGQCFMVKF